MLNISDGLHSDNLHRSQSYHPPLSDEGGQRVKSNPILPVDIVKPKTLLIYALNDPYVDELFNHAGNQKLLSERGVYTLPVTSFLLATNPIVRPMIIECLEQSLAHPEIGLTQSDINELKAAQCSGQTKRHQDLCCLKKHSQWGKIETLTKKFVADFESHYLSDCKRLIIFLHGNITDDDSFTTTCFGTYSSGYDERLYLCQNIQTLSDAISIFLNSGGLIFDSEKSVDVDFVACANWETKKLYLNFEKYLTVSDKNISVKVFYFSSFRRLYSYRDNDNLGASFFCFSDIESYNLSEKYENISHGDISTAFSYPYHYCNNQSTGFFKGECDQLIKNEVAGYVGQFDVINDFVLSKEKTTSLRALAGEESVFSWWDQMKDQPREIQNCLINNEHKVDAVQKLLSFKDGIGRNLVSHMASVQGEGFIPKFIDGLIKVGGSPDQYDHDGRNPLYWAANNGCLANMTQLLMSMKARQIGTAEQRLTLLNKQNVRGMPPIGKAIFHGHIDVVALLLNQKAHLEWQDRNGHTPLILACMSGNKAVVDLILHHLKGNQQINRQDNIGLTPLHYAFETNLDIAPALLARGADLSIKGGEYFNTPLITACQKYCDLEQVFNVVSDENHLARALHLFNIASWWPLGIACAERKPALVKQLMEAGSGLTQYNAYGSALQIACKVGNQECLDALLGFIHDPDSCGSPVENKSVLHLVINSCSTENVGMIKALLSSGSDPLKTDRDGNMELHHAIKARSEVFFALLDNEQVKRGINHINGFGYAPLHLVCYSERQNLVCNPDRQDPMCNKDRQDRIRRLIEAGADISIRDFEGNTILHQCAAKGFTDCLQRLLMPPKIPAPEIERRLSCKNRLGYTPIPAPEIERRLSCKNRLGYTPVALASVSNSYEAKRFIEAVLKKCV